MFVWLVIIYAILFAFLTWRRFDIALAVFFFALPSYLIRFSIGPLPTTLLEIMLWIITIIWLIKFRSRITYHVSHITKRNKLLFIGTALFLLAATTSIFTSTNLREALGEWKAFYVEPTILFFILATTLSQQFNNLTIKQSENPANILILGLVTGGLITSLLAIYQHFTGWVVPDAFWTNQNTYRVTAWYGFPNAVGLFLAPIVPLALYLAWQARTGFKKVESIKYKVKSYFKIIFFLLSTFSFILAIIFSKGTGPLIGLLAGAGFLMLITKKTRLIACLVSLVGLVSLVSLPTYSPIKQELLFQDRSGQIRLGIWSETIDFLKDNPIWGAGLASYQEKIKPYHMTVNGEGIEIFHHPHNIFLTMYVKTGLLGLAGFILIIIWFFKTSLSRIMEHGAWNNGTMEQWNNQSLFLLSSMVIILIAGLVDSPYIKNDLAIFFWLLPVLLIMAQHDDEFIPQ